MSFPCYATETLDCDGTPYGVMIHVGSDEKGEDYLSDMMLFEEDNADPIAVYFHNDLNITSFKWVGGESGNMMELSSKPESKTPVELRAGDSHGVIKVYEKEFPIICYWKP